MWGFHCSVNERSWKCWQMQMGAREILHSEIQRFYERNSKIENHFKTKNVKPTKHNHAKLKSIVFFLSQTLFVFAGQDWIAKLSCGSLWLTDFKVLVSNYGRNRCNVSNWHWQHMLRGRSVLQRWFTEREGGSSQLSRLIWSSSELAAGRKKKKRICWRSMSF